MPGASAASPEPRGPGLPRRRGSLARVALTFAALLGLAELAVGPRVPTWRGEGVLRDRTENEDLGAVLARASEARGARWLVLGNSQLGVPVSAEGVALPDPPEAAFGARLAARLVARRRGPITDPAGPAEPADPADPVNLEVLDLSAPGQSTVEAARLLRRTLEMVPLRGALIGVSPATTESTNVRAAIDRFCQPAPAATPEDDGPTLQARVDDALASWARGRSHLVDRRLELRTQLWTRPVFLHARLWLRTRVMGERIARAIPLTAGLEPSLEALGEALREARAAGCRARLLVLPWRRDQRPPPFTEEAHRAFLAAVRALASQVGAQVDDLSQAVPSPLFTLHSDGSPDGLHLTPEGHRLLAARVAARLEG